MKKLALLLAAMTAVSAAASAKEVVAAPVVAVEAVCPEPVVKWRPTGYIDLGVKYYGEEELDQTTHDYLRTQLSGSINLTEKDRFDFRARNYAKLTEEDHTRGTTSNNLRFRYYHNSGLLGDSKVSLKHRVQYYNRFDGTDTHDINYQMQFQFAEYFGFMPSWFDVTSFEVNPKVGYSDLGGEADAYTTYGGLDFTTWSVLPLGFELELNVYTGYYSLGAGRTFFADEEGNRDDSQFNVQLEAYLYRNFELYSAGRNKLELTTEFGYETYDLYNSNAIFSGRDNNDDTIIDEFSENSTTYQAYALLGLQLTHQYSDTLKLYGWAGGEYRNWAHTDVDSAKNWGWQPQVTVGFKSTF